MILKLEVSWYSWEHQGGWMVLEMCEIRLHMSKTHWKRVCSSDRCWKMSFFHIILLSAMKQQHYVPTQRIMCKHTVSSICSTLSCSQASSPSMMTAMRVWFWVKPSMVLAIFDINSTSCFRTWLRGKIKVSKQFNSQCFVKKENNLVWNFKTS